MPGWSKLGSSAILAAFSGPPQLLLITVEPSAAAAFCERYSEAPLSVAWTTRILQVGHTALAIWTSSAVSSVQSSVTGGSAGSGEAWPASFTTARQPFARVHGGRLYCVRYIARSLSSAA